MKNSKRLLPLAVAAAIGVPSAAFATNGMDLEGYGPIATGMGGASMAYDNGTAASMNNPATLGLMANGESRLDVALGFLGPDVKTTVPAGLGGSGNSSKSKADAFYMPAIGWAKRQDQLTYGVGVFAQGGMGTEFGADSDLALGTGNKVMSQVSVGRFIVPLAYNVNDQVTVGGSVDYVWANMDLRMAMSGAQFGQLMQRNGGTVGGDMRTALEGAIAGGMLNPANPINTARFDFADSSDYTGKATGSGLAGKLGVVFKVDPQWSVGVAYHSETSLSDLKASGAKVTMNANFDNGVLGGGAPNGTYTAMNVPVSGTIKVKNFQWPSTYGVGVAFQANDRLKLVADLKQINWADVMKNFHMEFAADTVQANPLAGGFAGKTLDVTMTQKWKDQTVTELGASYAFTDAFTGRIGANLSDNPIPDKYVNPLFPAIIKSHYTAGFGYTFSNVNSIDFSLSYAPEVKVTGSGPLNSNGAGTGVEIKHSQTNWQFMYSHRF